MWLFTEQGFYSVVQNRYDDRVLLVRARLRGDLERLRTKEPRLGPTLVEEGSDYRFRALIPREAFAELAASLVRELAYDNFKRRVKEVDGSGRSEVYGEVWSTMYLAQEAEREQEMAARRAAATDADFEKVDGEA